MHITITGRKVNLKNNFKELVEKKLSRYDRIFEENADAHVVVTEMCIRDRYKDELQRIFNFKFPYEYIDRYQEMLDRKEKVKSIYKQFLLSATPSTN